MIKPYLTYAWLLAAAWALLAGCKPDAPAYISDPAHAYALYNITYRADINTTTVQATLVADSLLGQRLIQPVDTNKFRFNGTCLPYLNSNTYSLDVPGFYHSGSLVYLDTKGTAYTTLFMDVPLLNIPPYLTSISRSTDEHMYLVGYTLNPGEDIIMRVAPGDNWFYMDSTYSGINIKGSRLHDVATGDSLTLNLIWNANQLKPTAAPKGGHLHIEVFGPDKKVVLTN
jgi:hypothetical protein